MMRTRGESFRNLRLSVEIDGSSSAPEVPSNKLGYISCWGESPLYNWQYVIFICDFDVGDVLCRIRIDYESFVSAAFCIIGSTLFVFEGFRVPFPDEKNLTVFKYELPLSSIVSRLKPNLELYRSMFIKAGELNGSKFAPAAIVLPTGNILVFSTTLEYQPVWRSMIDFEIFDPVKEVSYELPHLDLSSCFVYGVERGDFFLVESHSIMEPLFLLLKTDIGFFTLNLEPPYKNKRWNYGDLSPFFGGHKIPAHTSNSFVVIRKEICIVPNYAYDINQSGRIKVNPFSRWLYKFPDLSFICNEGFVCGGLTVLEDSFNMHDDDIGLCFMKLGVNADKRIFMRFDEYRLNKEECWKELAAIRAKEVMERKVLPLPGVNKVKSFEYIDEVAKFEATFAFLHFSYIQRV